MVGSTVHRHGWPNSSGTYHVCGAPIALKGGARGTIQGHGLHTANIYNLSEVEGNVIICYC